MFREDPLLKVGAIAMALALALVIFAVAVSIAVRGVPERVVASERVAKTKPAGGPLIRGESPTEPWREKGRSLPTPEDSKDDLTSMPSGGESEPGFAAIPGAEPRSQSEPVAQGQTQVRAEPKAQPEPNTEPEPKPGQQTLPAAEGSDWARPTDEEIEAAKEPRHYSLPPGAIMGLTIEKLGIYNAPVFDSDSQWALANGIAHMPETSLPWSPTPQRNVYLAGHRMGYRGTWSRMLFYNLGKLGEGDKVVLKDRQGRRYEYRVSETFLANPTDSWVTGQVRGRDMLTLQTCTPIPTFEKRLIVRADRV